MDYIQELTDATDPKLAGGKSANLGELLKTGIPVPPGFTITTETFKQHMSSESLASLINRSLAAIEHGASMEAIEVIADEIRRTVKSVPVNNEFANALGTAYRRLGARSVAVRSSATTEDSATAAWAGQLETYLYIDSERILLDAVLDCWASLFTPRALSYRLSQGLLNRPVAVAVVVQMMVVAQKAGVAFTADPVTNDPNVLVVEAVWGDCEQLVSGAVTPDSYRFDKQTKKLAAMELAVQETVHTEGQQIDLPIEQRNRQKLNAVELAELARLCERAETHFGRPQDIEWLHDGRTFYIVQARPITTFEAPVSADGKSPQ